MRVVLCLVAFVACIACARAGPLDDFEKAKALVAAGRFAEALPVVQRLRDWCEKNRGPDDAYTVQATRFLGVLHGLNGDLDKAETLLTWALTRLEKKPGPDHPDTIETVTYLALAFQYRGEPRRAEPLLERALAVTMKQHGADDPRTLYQMTLLGTLYADYLSDFARSEPLLSHVLASTRRQFGEQDVRTADAMLALAGLYADMKDFPRAEALYKQGLALEEKVLGPHDYRVGLSLYAFGDMYNCRNDASKAVPQLKRALGIVERSFGMEHPVTALVADCYGQALAAQGQILPAEQQYARALIVFQKVLGARHFAVAVVRQKIGRLQLQRGDLAGAAMNFAGAIEIGEKVAPDHLLLVEARYDSAWLEVDRRQPEAARRAAVQAWSAQQRALANVLSFAPEGQRLEFKASMGGRLDPGALFAAVGDVESLAEVLLRTKGVVLDSLVEDVRLAEASRDDKMRAAAGRLRTARDRLAELVFDAPRDASPQAVQRRADERKTLEAEVASLESTLARGAGGGARRALSVTLAQVRAALPADAALIEFTCAMQYVGGGKFERRYGAVVVTPDALAWVNLGAAAAIDERLADYRRLGRMRVPPSVVIGLLRRLYNDVWAPLERHLPAGVKRVVLSPDGDLSFLSFATLLTPKSQFLAERYELRYVASGRDLLDGRPASGSREAVLYGAVDFDGGPMVAGGPRQRVSRDVSQLTFAPLPGTRDECRRLEALLKTFGLQPRLLEGTAATEGSLRHIASPYILHLATHGFFLPAPAEIPIVASTSAPIPGSVWASPRRINTRGSFENPMLRSGLALTGAAVTVRRWARDEYPAAADDGIVFAQEVGALDLRDTWLVTLSACQTGLGEARAGEGVMGLRRAFVQAGARNVLMTLWPVADSETAAFMVEFYGAALRSRDPGGALHEVQRRWLVRLRKASGIDAAVRIAGPFIVSAQGPMKKQP